MDELSDYELEKTDEESAPSGPGRHAPPGAVDRSRAIVTAGVAAYFWFWFPRPQEAPTSTAPTVAYRPLPAPAAPPPRRSTSRPSARPTRSFDGS